MKKMRRGVGRSGVFSSNPLFSLLGMPPIPLARRALLLSSLTALALRTVGAKPQHRQAAAAAATAVKRGATMAGDDLVALKFEVFGKV